MAVDHPFTTSPEMVLRKLSGRADVQDALRRLDKGTQGEIRGSCISCKGYARNRCARRWKPGEGCQRQCGGDDETVDEVLYSAPIVSSQLSIPYNVFYTPRPYCGTTENVCSLSTYFLAVADRFPVPWQAWERVFSGASVSHPTCRRRPKQLILFSIS